MNRVIALILGGGQGKRLFPLTMYRSKPAVPIGGKYRLIDIPVSNCLHSGIKDIHVLTQFNSQSLNNHINNTYRFDYFSRAFVRILAAEQTLGNANWFQGTADAVRKNLFHLDLNQDDEVLILSGDHLYEMDYRHMVAFHRRMKADFTVSVTPVRKREAKDFGILKLDAKKRIVGFREKPRFARDFKELQFTPAAARGRVPFYPASMGVYLFNAKTLKKVLKGDGVDFGKEVIPGSIGRFKAFGYVFDGYWADIGNIRSFYEANIGLARSRAQFSFFYKGEVFTRPRFLPPARVTKCAITRSLVAEGCVIGDARISDSVIGLRTIVGEGCRISRTVVMGADFYENASSRETIRMGIGDGSAIDRAIIDKNARIGKNVVIKNIANLKDCDADNFYIRDGIVIIPKGALIKDGTRI